MLKKTIFAFIIILLANLVLAQEAVAIKSKFSSTFYIVMLSIIIIVGLVIFFIKKLNYNLNQILKSIGISLLITLVIEILFYIIGSLLGLFKVYCKTGAHCPSAFETFLFYLPYTTAIIFLVTILIYYIIKFLKNK